MPWYGYFAYFFGGAFFANALPHLAFAYLLLMRIEAFDLRSWSDVGVCFVGFGAMALQCARSLGRIRKQT